MRTTLTAYYRVVKHRLEFPPPTPVGHTAERRSVSRSFQQSFHRLFKSRFTGVFKSRFAMCPGARPPAYEQTS